MTCKLLTTIQPNFPLHHMIALQLTLALRLFLYPMSPFIFSTSFCFFFKDHKHIALYGRSPRFSDSG